MSIADDPARVDEEERALTLIRFNEDDAWWLGCHLREAGVRGKAAIAIEIVRGSTRLFTALLAGATGDNLAWIRRKIAVAMQFERSTYAVGLMMRTIPDGFERFGLDHRRHAAAGGAVPIRVADTGMIGVVAVSGLPQAEDHQLVIEALRALKSHQERSGDGAVHHML